VKQLNNFGDRGRASKALIAVGAPAEKELLKLVNDPAADQGARDEAARILKAIGSKENVGVTSALANLGNADAGRRRDAARTLAEMKAPDKGKQAEVAAALLRTVSDSDAGVREQAAKALVVWATPEQTPDLLRLLDNMQAPVRQSAMLALGKLQEEKAAAPIAAHLLLGEDRRAAGDALRALGPKAETEVAKYLAARDKAVVLDACKILGDIGTKKSVLVLKRVVALTQAKQKDIAVAASLAIQQISSR
ncbi:MAG TPA: HEAT repeat domain-containing protein, partial [Gemmataceae bacterium]|nr:HEAT repeat domain-containing protein [Gemmataceae bacterium]